MLAIYKREMRSYFTGVIGYIFTVAFLAVGGLLFGLTTLYAMSASVTNFYTYMLLASAVLLPLLTMKSFSEERKTKTEQLLLTAPIPLVSMVIGKFLAALTMFFGCLVVCSLYFVFLAPYATVKVAILLGNALALFLVGAAFIAVGLFVSSLTENQLSAAVGTIAILFVFLAVGVVGQLFPANYLIRSVFDSISLFTRFGSFVNGYLDFASMLYYLMVTAVFLYLTVRIYDRRRRG